MAKTWVYIDGFNLYYGALKRSPYKWLDQSHLVESQFPATMTDAKGKARIPASGLFPVRARAFFPRARRQHAAKLRAERLRVLHPGQSPIAASRQ